MKAASVRAATDVTGFGLLGQRLVIRGGEPVLQVGRHDELVAEALDDVRLALRGEDADVEENALMRAARRRFSITEEYHGNSLTVVTAGKRMATPMLLVLVAIGALLFPALFLLLFLIIILIVILIVIRNRNP